MVLKMSEIRQSIKGNNNVQSITNIENAYILNSSNETLTKSEVSELLDLFWSIDRDELPEYDVSKLPSGVLEKLAYNNAMRYKVHFENHALDYAVIEQVMGQYTNSQSIVCFVRDYYIKSGIVNEKGDIMMDDGNSCLDFVFSKIKNHILNSENFSKKQITDQKLESFCYGLLQYCISRCKVLENVPRLNQSMKVLDNAAS